MSKLQSQSLQRYNLIPPGTTLDDTLTLPPGDTILLGQGAPLVYTGPADRPAILAPRGSRLVIRDLTLIDSRNTGTWPEHVRPTSVGIKMVNAHHSLLDNVTIEGFAFGLDSDNSYYCDHDRCQFRFNQTGARTLVGNVSAFRQCHFEYNRVGAVDAVRLDGCTFEGHWEDAVRYTNPHARCTIENGYFESNCQRNWSRNARRILRSPGTSDILATAPTILVMSGANYFANSFAHPGTDETDAPTHHIAGDFHSLHLTGTARFFFPTKWPHISVPPDCDLQIHLVGEQPTVGRAAAPSTRPSSK
jgi:hypothetical protein